MGKFTELTEDEVQRAKSSIRPSPRATRQTQSIGPQSKTLKYLADRTINSPWSAYLCKEPAGIIVPSLPIKPNPAIPLDELVKIENAKFILDKYALMRLCFLFLFVTNFRLDMDPMP